MNEFGRVLENALIKDHTTYKLSGTINKIIYPENIIQLQNLLKYFKKNYNGIIIKLDKLNNLDIDGLTVKVGAGYNLMKLAVKCANQELIGLEKVFEKYNINLLLEQEIIE